jgi:hypothetical protein
MPDNVNDIRELVPRTSDGLRLSHAKEDDCLVAARFAFVGVSAIWLNDACVRRQLFLLLNDN